MPEKPDKKELREAKPFNRKSCGFSSVQMIADYTIEKT